MKYKSSSLYCTIYLSDFQEYYILNYFIKKTENKQQMKEKLYIYSGKNCFFL